MTGVQTCALPIWHKLKAAGAPTDFVETVYGIGYRLKALDNFSDFTVQSSKLDVLPSAISVPTTTSQNGSISDPRDFLTTIWNRHYPQMLDRVASIDRVIIAAEDRSLTTEIRHQARHCAHNLAGSLGTFG